MGTHADVVFTGGPSTPLTWSGLAEALGAYTIGSSYVNHPDDQTGAIEEGRLADLVVLDRDPFRGPPGEIASTAVEFTYVAGEQVYARK